MNPLYLQLSQDGPDTTLDRNIYNINESIHRRHAFIAKYGFSVPNKEAVDAITKVAVGLPILEIGAGVGIWSCLLEDDNPFKVVATDAFKKGEGDYSLFKDSDRYTYVEAISAIDAIAKYDACNVLLCSWPCYKESWFTEACLAFTGQYIVYVGERRHGCTADDSFFDYAENRLILLDEIDIPRWPSIHDHLFIYKKRT